MQGLIDLISVLTHIMFSFIYFRRFSLVISYSIFPSIIWKVYFLRLQVMYKTFMLASDVSFRASISNIKPMTRLIWLRHNLCFAKGMGFFVSKELETSQTLVSLQRSKLEQLLLTMKCIYLLYWKWYARIDSITFGMDETSGQVLEFTFGVGPCAPQRSCRISRII